MRVWKSNSTTTCAILPMAASRWPCRLDLTVQAATEEVLYGGMKLMNAKGATSVLMDVYTAR